MRPLQRITSSANAALTVIEYRPSLPPTLVVFNDMAHFTLPLGVAAFQSQYTQDTARILAFTALSMVPSLAFFVFAERRIVGGLTGAIKG